MNSLFKIYTLLLIKKDRNARITTGLNIEIKRNKEITFYRKRKEMRKREE